MIGKLLEWAKKWADRLNYPNTGRFLLDWFVVMPFVVYSLLSIAFVFQQGAVDCVKFQPIVTMAKECISVNNVSVKNPDFVFIPQLKCERLAQKPGAGSNYNWSAGVRPGASPTEGG